MELTDKHILNIARKYSLGGANWKVGWSFVFSDPSELVDFARKLIAAHCRAAQKLRRLPLQPFTEHDLRQSWNRCEPGTPWDSLESWEKLAWAQQQAILADRTARPALPPSSPHTPPSHAAAPSPAGSTDEAPGSPPRPPLADVLRIQCTGSRSPDDLADALRYLRPFVDVARMRRHLEALERIQHTGGEDVEHDSPELSDQEIAERAAMLIQALTERGREGHS